MTQLVFDIEANNLTRDVTEMHCIVTEDIDTGAVRAYHDYFTMLSHGTLQQGCKALIEADLLIGHNIATYDIEVVERLGKVKFTDKTVFIDTMILSQILAPHMLKGNSIEGWIKRLELDEVKLENTDWTILTTNILNRCISDVKANTHIFRHLVGKASYLQNKHKDLLNFAPSMELEVEVGRIHHRQVLHGVGYNVLLARQYKKEWDNKMDWLTFKILAVAPKKCTPAYKTPVNVVYYKQTAKQIGNNEPLKYVKAVQDWYKDDPIGMHSVKGPFSRIEFVDLDLYSPEKVKECLLGLGWQPTEWNYGEDDNGRKIKTSPKLTEDSYGSLPEGLGKMIAHFNILKHRRSLLVNFKLKKGLPSGSLITAEKTFDPETGMGTVSADAFTCGTNTARYTHTKPVANIPKANDPEIMYGTESRMIYMPPAGSTQVGADLAGIEARRLTDLCFPYPGGPEFAELVLNGDYHGRNAVVWGVKRDLAKTILYALMYGAGDPHLGVIAGQSGARIRAAFLEANPAYAKLVQDLEDAWRANGRWIPSIDKRPLYPKSKKDILNTKLQGDSAIIFKLWMIRCSKLEDVKLGYAHQMIAYHDELQFAYYKYDSDHSPECFGDIVCREAVYTGEDLHLNVPLAAEYKVGHNYAECH